MLRKIYKNNRYSLISILYFIVFIVLIITDKFISKIITSLSEPIGDISLVLFLMINLVVLIVSVYNLYKSFKLKKFLKEEHSINWTYSIEEWQTHIKKEIKLRYKDELNNWGNFMFKFLIGFSFYIIIIVLYFSNELEMMLLLIIAGVLLPIYLLIRELIKVKLFEYYNIKINPYGGFLLTNFNALVNGEFHDMKYTYIKKEIQDGYLFITYTSDNSEKQSKYIRVPIPKGREDEAIQYINPTKHIKVKNKSNRKL